MGELFSYTYKMPAYDNEKQASTTRDPISTSKNPGNCSVSKKVPGVLKKSWFGRGHFTALPRPVGAGSEPSCAPLFLLPQAEPSFTRYAPAGKTGLVSVPLAESVAVSPVPSGNAKA